MPHWRFKLEHRPVAWTDLVRGATEFHGEHLSDPVLIRADGLPLYTFSSVVDDVELGVTHVIRGEDHVTNTAYQIQIFEASGSRGAGLRASLADHGQGRRGALEAHGQSEPRLAARGRHRGDGDQQPAGEARHLGRGRAAPRSRRALVAEFDFAKFGRAQPHLDPAELDGLNAKLLHQTPFETVGSGLPAGATAEFWAAVRPNLARIADAGYWWQVCTGEIAPVIAPEEAAFLAEAADLLPQEQFDGTTWKTWTGKIAAASGRKGRALYQPLRLALTARDHGPELQALLPLIGRDRALRRLRGETA